VQKVAHSDIPTVGEKVDLTDESWVDLLEISMVAYLVELRVELWAAKLADKSAVY
jgi:hypothetical protein